MNLKGGLENFITHLYKNRLIVFLGVTVLCGFVVFAVMSLKPEEKAAIKDVEGQFTGMPVSLRLVKPGTYPAIVKSFGEVVPLWQTIIKSQVDGQIIFLSENLRVGNIVKQGELLVQIEKSDFAMQVAEAKNRLAAAKVALLKEQREANQAHRDWERSKIKGNPESSLVLHKPQLEAAQSELAAARAALARAETLLQYTDVSTPFDGVIMQCMVSRRETLFTGGEIATIFGLDTVEVSVNLDAEQWALLPESIADADVRLYDPRRTSSWTARVVRESRHLDRNSRLRTLFFQVKHPLEQTPPLLPGTFVQAEITGRSISGLLCIPEAALTKQGLVWFADRENHLQPKRLEPVFYGEGIVFIRTPEDMEESLRVAISPNSSFVSGLRVKPIANPRGNE
jgi:RND family efflux transporter MFP subunit